METKIFKIRVYNESGDTVRELFFNNFIEAVKSWVDNAEWRSPTNPTVWAWYESQQSYIRLHDVNWFELTPNHIAEYLTRLFVYSEFEENAKILEIAINHYNEYKEGETLEMYKFTNEAIAIHKAASKTRKYSFRDDITGKEVTGTAEKIAAFIAEHDKKHNDNTSWGPTDKTDVEAWALLEALYNL